MGTRDDFTMKTKRVIASRVGFRCSHPECDALTVGPTVDTEDFYNIGAACHIAAASDGGPRFDPNMTPKERKHPDNGIWMCRTHADEIDDDEAKFTVDLLKKWKKDAEDRISRRLGKAIKVDTRPTEFVELSTAERYGLKAMVELESGARIPFANTFDVHEDDDLLGMPTFIIRFLISKNKDVESIMLYELVATVNDYYALPSEYKKAMYALPQTVYPYVVELDKPIDGRPRPCSAKWYVPMESKKPVEFTPLLIQEDYPQVIDVRFTAPTSGIYVFALDAVITCGVDKYTFRILDPMHVLFEKFDEVYDD